MSSHRPLPPSAGLPRPESSPARVLSSSVAFCVLILFVLSGCGGGAEGRTAGSTSPSPDTMANSSPDASLPLDSLTSAQRRRLGPALRRLLTGDSAGMQRIEPVGSRGGADVFSVLVQSTDPAALRRRSLPLTSVVGETITARWTAAEILVAASTDGVTSVRADRSLESHPAPDGSSGGKPPTPDTSAQDAPDD